jgi:peptidoglycan/LPS O-acetylase OafA/YrhL
MATVGIFLFHLWSVVPLTSTSPIWGPLLDRLPFLGALGVIVFNIITGFVLAVPYLGHSGHRSIPPALAFFRQRFGRICRHYYPTLVLWTLGVLLLPAPEPGGRHVLVGFVTHVVFLHTLSPGTFFSLVPAFWWLGMLAQFYLVCPWLLRFFQRLGPGTACGLACALPWAGWVILTHYANQFPGSTLAMVHYLIYFNLPVRLPEFALGMWLASAWNRGLAVVRGPMPSAPPHFSLGATVLAPLLVGFILFRLLHGAWLAQLPRPLDHLYLVFWCGVAVLATLRWSGAIRLGSGRLILDLAAASYGIYLLHQPLLGYANPLLVGILTPFSRFVILLVGIGLLCYWAAVGLNLLLYRLFGS